MTTNKRIELSKLTIEGDQLSPQDSQVISEYIQECHEFQEWVKNQFSLSPIQAFKLSKILINHFHNLIEDDARVLKAVKTKAYEIQLSSPDETD